MSVLGKIGGAFKAIAKQPGRAVGAIEDRNDQRLAELSDIILDKLFIRVAALIDKMEADDTFSDLSDDTVAGIAGKYELVIPEIRIRVERRVK